MNNLLFKFSVDKTSNTIHIQREFDARLDLVWKAWTTAELLDQWWGPKPWRAETKTMNFREGGHWLYAMIGPDGEKHWSKANYLAIDTEKSFTARDGFCDENGVTNTGSPQNLWENHFTEKEEQTLVTITLTFDSLEDMETIIEMGFKEGFTMGLNQLDEFLSNLKNNR